MGHQLELFFDQSKDTMKQHAIIAGHILGQFRSCYLDLFSTTAHERYDLLMQRNLGIVDYLNLTTSLRF